MTVKELKAFANEVRIATVKCLETRGFGHIGGCLSIADVLAVLYNGEMNIDPKEPQKTDRDMLVVSKGHSGPAVFAALALKGYFPMEWEVQGFRVTVTGCAHRESTHRRDLSDRGFLWRMD